MTLLATVVLLPLLLGTGLCYWLGRTSSYRQAPAWAAALITAAALGLLMSAAPAVFDGEVVLGVTEWVPAIGLNLGFRLDGLALMFAGLITGIGLLIVMYAAYYLGHDDPLGKFYSLLMLFMGAMLGIALSDNLLLLVVFWELTSVSSFLLVGYWGHKEEARQGARMALAVTGGGGLALLAGVIVLGQIAGTYELSQMLDKGALVQADSRYPLALALILVGCFSKSAQWPFHFWLPGAMAAPTPVSAYLHSATMVKAGLFLMMRLYPVIGGPGLFETVVASVGLATLVFAAFVALFKHDIKGLLAYSTISHLGFITFLIGLASPMSAVVAVFHLLNHASFKAALFMTAGIIDHETGSRDMRRLGGLMKWMPWVGSLALLASASMAGLPPFNGFLSKELMLDQALQADFWGPLSWAIPVLATLGGLFSVAYSVRFVHDVFFNGPARASPNPQPQPQPQPQPHEPPIGMTVPVAVLVVVCVAVGLAPMWLAGPLVRLAAGSMLGVPAPAFEFALWHGFNLPLLMSTVAVAGGTLLYFGLASGGWLHRYLPGPFSAQAVFNGFIDGLIGLSGRSTRWLESGSLQRYASTMVALAVGLSVWAMLGQNLGTGERELLDAPPLAVGIWLLLIVLGAAVLAMQRQRFAAVILVGGVGLVCSLAFLALSAPDLALTQLSVDVVSTALLLLGLALLPQRSPIESSRLRRGRDALLAIAGGGGIGWLAWLMLTRNHDSISWYFLEKSVPAGGGTNPVNVILVDFRGYDTFGEIAVLGIAAVGVLALLDGLRVSRPKIDGAGRPWSFAREPLMLRVAARLVLPLALVLSAYIFWRGHNLPGGGFIAGLITGVALLLQYMAQGQLRAESVLHAAGGQRFARWIGTGLGIAWLTGIGAFAFGRPFLTSAHGHPSVALLGELPLATASLFDLGVYITVVGATLLMLSVLGAASKKPNKQSGSPPGARA